MVAYFYQIFEHRELLSPDVLIHHTLRPVDHDLKSLKLIYNIEENQILSNNALRSNAATDSDGLFYKVLVEGFSELGYRHCLFKVLQARMCLRIEGILALRLFP